MTRNSPLDRDAVVQLLAPRRRRELLRCLQDHPDEAVDLPTLASAVSERCPGEGAMGTRMEIRLHHSDLPKLDEAGLVEYDRFDSRVAYDRHEGVEALLETLATRFD